MHPADGVIILNKPTGITSAKALYKVRAITGLRKSGHTGTLDPAADGVLVLCVGKATKLVERVMDQPKVYRATARLDVTSASFDSDRPLQPVNVPAPPTCEAIAAALAAFQGEIEQVPPAISALKVGGVPAYKLAGAENEPRLRARRVRIYWTHVHAYAWPALDFEMACGRGAYVRALIRDLGATLNTGGCLTGLCRRAIGPFTLDRAWTFEQLEGARQADYLLPLEEVRAQLEERPLRVPDPPAP